jgi:hypothetical protein
VAPGISRRSASAAHLFRRHFDLVGLLFGLLFDKPNHLLDLPLDLRAEEETRSLQGLFCLLLHQLTHASRAIQLP